MKDLIPISAALKTLTREDKWARVCSDCGKPIAEPRVVCASCNGGTAVIQGVPPGNRHLRIASPQEEA